MRTVSIVLLFTATIAGAVCAESPGQNTKSDDIVLGGLFNLHGPQAELDIPTYRGAQLAVGEINAAGGILGRHITLVAKDGKSRPERLAKATEKILRKYPAVSAFLGLSDTDMVLGAAPAAAAAEFAFERLGARTASVLYDSTDTYTNLLQDYFRTRFVDLGGDIVSAEPYSPGELSAPVSRLLQADIIFLSAGLPNHALEAVGLLRAAGFAVPIVGGDGFDAGEVWSGQTAVHDVYFTTHVYLGGDTTNPQVAGFRSAYGAAHPGEAATAFAALGYDAVKLVAHAIRQAGSAAPADVLAGLAGTSGYDGVTGSISYESGTRIPVKTVSIIRIEAGAYRLANEWTPAGVPAP